MSSPLSRSPVCAALATASMLLGACSLTQPAPVKSLHAIPVSPREDAAATATDAVLRIVPVRIESPFQERSFHYRTGPNTFEADYYVSFVAPPDRLLTAEIRKWMAAAGPYAVVVDAASSVATNLTLSCLVSELCGDYSDPSAPTAVVRARFFLIDESEVESRVLFTKEYAEAMRAAGGQPAELAAAWGAALEQILAALSADLQLLE